MTGRGGRMLAAVGLFSGLFYAGFGGMANHAVAQGASQLEQIRRDDMRKLDVHAEPQQLPGETFTDPEGNAYTLADYAGKIVLVNFWATWCAPCREEMPDLDALNADLGGEDFEVVTIASGRNSLSGIRAFFEEEQIETLPILLDPQGQLSRRAGVLGLPVSILMNREGREIARLQGGAHWNDAPAREIIAAAIAAD
ncbi:TlpA disulfide reductase family protein [Pontivivens nitratireducens]|uniref:TlpA disulfide reductase family protein n=1 Tax=Pontivivens nitratireducens TaxID=2758038 RepID=UPI00201BC088|nr:TlpA family protein disulfide reductase [Pontibrevibacter nitratireducens]